MTARDARTGTDQARLDSGWGQEAARLLALLRQDRVAGVSVVTMRERGIEAPLRRSTRCSSPATQLTASSPP